MNGHAVYVANTSIQNHLLMFTLGVGSKMYEQNIPMGTQVLLLGRDLTQEELAFFLARKEPYGYRNVKDLKGEKGFVGICYSIDVPVNLDYFKSNFEHNEAVLTDAQEVRQRDSAVAISSRLSKVSEATPLRSSSVEVIEEGDAPSGRKQVAKGVEVVAPDGNSRNREQRRRA